MPVVTAENIATSPRFNMLPAPVILVVCTLFQVPHLLPKAFIVIYKATTRATDLYEKYNCNYFKFPSELYISVLMPSLFALSKHLLASAWRSSLIRVSPLFFKTWPALGFKTKILSKHEMAS